MSNSQFVVVVPSAPTVTVPSHKVVGFFDTHREAGKFNAEHGFRGEIHPVISPEAYDDHLEIWGDKKQP